MTIKVPKLLLTAAAGAYLLGVASLATAGNHLKCYKVKDPLGVGAVKYTTDLVSNTGLPTETGCSFKARAQFCCDPVDKVNTSPAPPGGGPTGPTTKFCCYKLKCAKVNGPFSVKDQFGSRTVTRLSAKLLCAPASPSGAFLDDSSVF